MFTSIDELPLGKLLQPIQGKGVKKQVPESKIRKLRRKGYK